jgi:tetratricopeptide (TPR) repeat protein
MTRGTFPLSWVAAGYRIFQKYDLAVADLTHAIAIDTQNPVLFGLRAVVLEALHAHEAALADSNRANELSPNDPQFLLQRGTIYVALGRFDDALADSDRALSFKPTVPEAYSLRAKTR